MFTSHSLQSLRHVRPTATVALMIALVAASCGGADSSSDDSAAPSAADSSASSDAGDPCDSFGFTGTAFRSPDDGFGQAVGDYTGDDVVDTRSRVKDGERAALFVASFEMEDRFLTMPDIEDGGFAMKFDVTGLDALSPGDSYDVDPFGRLPLISNGGSGGNAGDAEDISGTVTLLEFNDSQICVDVNYEDAFHRIVGTFNVPNEPI